MFSDHSFVGAAQPPRYAGHVPGEAPVNPVVATWRWLGFRGNQFEPVVLFISAVGLAVGGGVWSTALGWALGVVVLSAALPLPGYFWRKRLAADDEEGDARDRLLEECLRPLLEFAATTTSLPRADRQRAAQSAADNAVRDLRNAFGEVTGVRVVVFKISDSGNAMQLCAHAGRQDRPGDFRRGTARGDKAFAVLEGSAPYVMVEDLNDAEPDEWQGTGAGYRTFISAPIRSADEGLGLLTVDAPVPGSLAKRHGSTLVLFAAVIGVFFAEATRSGGGAR